MLYFIFMLGFACGAFLGFIAIAYNIYRAIRECINPELKNDPEWNNSPWLSLFT